MLINWFFDKLFEYAKQKNIVTIEELLEDETDLFYKEGKNRKARCKVIKITYHSNTQKAIIAHTFPNQALSNAYERMQKYGAFCYKCWKNSQR